MPEEIFDIVDENDRVIGQLPRSEVHRLKLRHRAVSIFIFNRRGQLLLQQRAASKDEYPLCYTSSASGHVTAGDDYDETAARELQEELGLSVPLERLAKFPASPETANEFTVLYRGVTDLPPKFAPNEIAGGAYYDLPLIDEQLLRAPEEFSPPFQVAFLWYKTELNRWKNEGSALFA
jgi:16S rRNA (adenine1518-N6/adenine1519-N6)-dimethyltransferase